MAMKNLTDAEMIETSAAWVDARRKRARVEAIPALAALLPNVTEAHRGLLDGGVPAEGSDQEKARASLYKEGVALDARHDRKGRGAFNLLSALADLAEDEATAAGFLALRQRLFPDGNLNVLKASWKGEAGNALRIKERVLADKVAVAGLRAVRLDGDRTLFDGVREFVDAGLRLGGVEDRRDALAAEGAREPKVESPSRVKARNRWIAVVGAFVSVVDDVLQLEGAARHELLGGLDEAERKADERALGRRTAEAEEPDAPAGPSGDGH